MRRPPITAGGALPWPFLALYGGLSVDEPAAWIAEVPRGRVVGAGAVVTPDNHVLVDVSRELTAGRDQRHHSLRIRSSLPPRRSLAGRIGVVAAALRNRNFFHWHVDVLPRIVLLQRSGTPLDAIIVNTLREPYQQETLQRLGVDLSTIIESDAETFHIEAETLVIPSLLVYAPTTWASRALHERLMQRRSGATQCAGRRLYISRSDAVTRQIVNHEALETALALLGFEKVELARRSSAEQRELFASADLVVAPHGAGLTNALFCRPGAALVEIFSPWYVNPVYWVLCEHLDIDYYCAVGRGPAMPAPPTGADAWAWFWNIVLARGADRYDIDVDVDAVIQLVNLASSRPRSRLHRT